MNSQVEIHRVRLGRVPRVGASVPVELRCAALLALYQPQSSLTSHYWDFLWQFHHVGLIDYELRFQFLSPLWRWGGGAENSVLNHDSVFLVT